MYTILIADDHVLFREGIHNIIGHWDDFEVIGEAANGLEAVEKARELLPDIILMDVAMPQLNGIEAAQKISTQVPASRIVMLTMSGEDDDLFHALKAGAAGYILKDTPSRRLHDLLRGVMHNETPISGTMATKIVKEFNHMREVRDPGYPMRESLDERERAILELLAQGKTNAEIAAHLFLSESTVKKDLHNILEKLQLNNRVEAAAYAAREGLGKP